MPGNLGLSHLLHRLTAGIIPHRRIKIRREIVDDHRRHLELLDRRLHLLFQGFKCRLPDLVGPPHSFENQHVAFGTHYREVLPLTNRHFGDTHFALIPEGIEQDAVGLHSALLRCQVIGLLEVDRVDVRLVDELNHINRSGESFADGVELLLGKYDVLTLLEFVAPNNLLVWHLFAVELGDPLVLDRTVVAFA